MDLLLNIKNNHDITVVFCIQFYNVTLNFIRNRTPLNVQNHVLCFSGTTRT